MLFSPIRGSAIFSCLPSSFARLCQISLFISNTSFSEMSFYYRKRGGASYIVREVRLVRVRERDTERERERERQKWRHHCRAKIGDEYCTFPCQKFAPQFLPSWMALSSHFPLPKTLHSSKQFSFFALSNGVTGDRSSKANDPPAPFFFSSKKSKKWTKWIPKTLGNRKRDCAWGCARG